jgi:Mg2+/Co2+ transporter CorB
MACHVSFLTFAEVALLLIFAGFLAGCESAINAISRVTIEMIGEKNSARALRIKSVVTEPGKVANSLPPCLLHKRCSIHMRIMRWH